MIAYNAKNIILGNFLNQQTALLDSQSLTKTHLGNLLSNLKRNGDEFSCNKIVELAVDALKTIEVKHIISVPSSNRPNRVDVARVLCLEISKRTNGIYHQNAIKRLSHERIRKISSITERLSFARRNFIVSDSFVNQVSKGEKVLLVDDFIDSGATFKAISEAINNIYSECEITWFAVCRTMTIERP